MHVPKYATHYYLPENGPFRSLSELPLGGSDPVFLELLSRHRHDHGYRRRYGRDYIVKRAGIEAKLRNLFMAKGGKPRRPYPFYLVLGESRWFKELNDSHMEVRLTLSELDPETTSLTYPDSFMALSRSDKAYYDQVFRLDELNQLVARFGIPKADVLLPYERYWESDFELYVEVQIWDDPPFRSAAESSDVVNWQVR